MEEFPEVLQFVCSYLNNNEINYVVVGGVAVMYHGVPRTTIDIDFILQIEEDAIPPFVEFLKAKGFATSVEDIQTALNEQSHCTAFFRNSLLRLDIQGVYSEFDRLTLERAISVKLFNTLIKIGSAEDTLVNKILFQGEQDLRDALGIFTRNHEVLDLDYIYSTSNLLGIQDLVDKFLKDSKNHF